MPCANRSFGPCSADDIREEYPLAMFNESLMEYFDASMAFSEGEVYDATVFTKDKYSHLEAWHSMLSKN